MKRNKKGNVITLLLENYILFTLVLIVIMITIFLVMFYRISKKIDDTSFVNITKIEKRLKAGEYSLIKFRFILGRGGYAAVLNESNEIEFISDDLKTVPVFTNDEIELIPDCTTYLKPAVTKYVNSLNEEITEIIIFKSAAEEISNLAEKYELDANGNILYSLNPTSKTAFTAREIAILSNEIMDDFHCYKYEFKDDSNGLHKLLLFESNEIELDLNKKIVLISVESIIILALSYSIMTALFIKFLNRKVKKPLEMLDSALDNFANGERNERIEYSGPREFVKLCENFNAMADKLDSAERTKKELEENKQEMLADISHDLKTPITVIQGYATALNDEIVKPSEQKQYLETIVKKSDALVGLIDAFSEYSKLEHPEFVLNKEPTDICVFMQDYMTDKYNELYLSGFELDVDIPEKHTRCEIDKLQMTRALDNIINNAKKHNANGTTIYCKMVLSEKNVFIIIADNGCGIPKELGNKIFQPFAMGDKSRTKQGSGLGLAITKKIIEAHNGSINLTESKEYKTEFLISLPI